MKSPRPSVAALLHGLGWSAGPTQIEIAPGITLCSLEGSVVGRLYWTLCEDTGVDDREPFTYHVYVRLDPTETEAYLLDFGDPYSLVDRFSNVLAVLTGQPVSMCRVIWSTDGFASATGTSLVYVSVRQTEFLQKTWPSMCAALAQDIAVAWRTQQAEWERKKSRGRLANALVYFYYAWRSHYADQICLNLAIVLEILFAPHSYSETTHQISFNVARFCGESAADRERLYQFVKEFYRVRSQIVHGGRPNEDKLIDAIIEAFPLVAGVLKRILLDQSVADEFANDTRRQAMLKRFLFE
ncbi:MAG: hypothetical protein JSU86_12230 [Phycisphaerales bacterium]|nr:MAG: hypothetical protein JSU86_12230 [Phycisphaerales bacterium]